MTGTKAIRIASSITGNRPVTKPRITGGIHRWNIIDEAQEGNVLREIVYVADRANDCHRNTPEKDHGRDKYGGDDVKQHSRLRAHFQVLPDDFFGLNAHLTCRELGWPAVMVFVESCFRGGHGLEFNEHCAGKAFLPGEVRALGCLDLRQQFADVLQAITACAKYRAGLDTFEKDRMSRPDSPPPPVALTGNRTGHVMMAPTKAMRMSIFRNRM